MLGGPIPHCQALSGSWERLALGSVDTQLIKKPGGRNRSPKTPVKMKATLQDDSERHQHLTSRREKPRLSVPQQLRVWVWDSLTGRFPCAGRWSVRSQPPLGSPCLSR